MKKILFTLTLIVAAVAGVMAQDVKPTTAAPDKAPKIQFKEVSWDFGKVTENVPAGHEFLFTNTGNAPLIIESVNASCGCTTPEWPKEPIMPGKTGVVKAVYNAARVGMFTKTVTVNSNAGQVMLTISGNVVQKEATPESPVVNPH